MSDPHFLQAGESSADQVSKPTQREARGDTAPRASKNQCPPVHRGPDTCGTSRPADRLPGRVDLLDLRLLTPQLLVDRLDVVVTLLAQRNLLHEARHLVDQCLLLGFD